MVAWCERLLRNVSAWRKIDAPEYVLDWIEQGVPITFKDQPPHNFELPNPHWKLKEFNFLQSEISKLLTEGAIEKCTEKPHCISPIKAVPKKSGDFRIIIDLHQLNGFTVTPKFQYDSFSKISDTLEVNDQFVTFDLKNGFLHVKLAANARTYFGFTFKGNYYRWCVTPFGWQSSPYFFHKLLRPVKSYLCHVGIRNSIYVDDILVASACSTITDHCDVALQTFLDLGFCINYEKSSLSASSTVEYLGYLFDSKGPDNQVWVYISRKRITKLRNDAKRAVRLGKVTARFLAKICGQAIAMSRAIHPCKLKLRPLYCLLATKSSWRDMLYIDLDSNLALNWWIEYSSSWNGSPIRRAPISVQIFTDSSSYGWGAVCNGVEASGTWPPDIAQEHINYKELLTFSYALACFKCTVKDKTVEILTDSVTAGAYINNMGGPVPKLSKLAAQIWQLAYNLNCIPVTHHIAGHLNKWSDRLSRIGLRYEWTIPQCLFEMLDNTFGPHTIDRFASINLHLLPRYNSRYLDPHTMGVDALAQQNWHREMNWVNPPWRLLHKTLLVIQMQRAHATVIAPWWPSQPFHPLLIKMSVLPPIQIKLTYQNVISVGPHPEPLCNRRWRIFAWRIYGGKN